MPHAQAMMPCRPAVALLRPTTPPLHRDGNNCRALRVTQPDFKTKAGPGLVARAGLFRATCEQRLLLLQQRQDSANGDGGTRENEEVKGDFHGKEAIALVIDLTLPGKDEAKKDHGDNNASNRTRLALH